MTAYYPTMEVPQSYDFVVGVNSWGSLSYELTSPYRQADHAFIPCASHTAKYPLMSIKGVISSEYRGLEPKHRMTLYRL